MTRGAHTAVAGSLMERVDLQAAAAAISGVAVRTPTIASAELAQARGRPVALKAECLQASGSFKVRGVLSKIATLPDGAAGLVTASAGNHGRAVADAARVKGVACDVYMPIDAPCRRSPRWRRWGAARAPAG